MSHAKTVDDVSYIGHPEATSAEALLERHYPHVRFLVEGHPHDAPKKVAKATAKAFNVIDPHYRVWWPREVAIRYLRGFVEQPVRNKRHELADRAVTPWSPAEATAALAEMIGKHHDTHIYAYDAEDFVLLSEALVGTDATVKGVVQGIDDALRKTPAGKEVGYLPAYCVLPLGALLLRASPMVAAAAKRTLGALLDEEPRPIGDWPLAQLAMLLHGRAGVERIAARWTQEEAYTFSGDPAYVREGLAGHRGVREIDAYKIWIAGDEAIDLYAKDILKTRKGDADFVAEGLGLFASPRVAPLMLALLAKKSVTAKRWFELHGARVADALAPMQKDKKLGALAEEVLARGAASKAGAKKPPAAVEPPIEDEELDEPAIEKAFDALMDQLVTAIIAARGKKAAEKRAWQEAIEGYMDIRSGMMNEDPSEYLGHFFMVDGVGLGESRATAWERLSPNDEESERWSGYLDGAS
ncbi:MAG: hypothetical protein KC731_13730 [Myxococcales bacterium]|nr:hypothetical protein [Myxococcales bacterium]